MADFGAGGLEALAAAGEAVAGVFGAGALTEVEGVFVAVDELSRLLDAVEYAVEEAVGALDGFVAIGIGRPGEGDDDLDAGKLFLDGADPLGTTLAEHFGGVLAEGKFQVGGTLGVEFGDTGFGAPAVVAILFGIEPEAFHAGEAAEASGLAGVVFEDGPVVVVGEVGHEAAASGVDHGVVEEVVGESTPFDGFEIGGDGVDGGGWDTGGVPDHAVQEAVFFGEPHGFGPFGVDEGGDDEAVVGERSCEFRVLGEVAGSDGLVAATGGELAAADHFLAAKFSGGGPGFEGDWQAGLDADEC